MAFLVGAGIVHYVSRSNEQVRAKVYILERSPLKVHSNSMVQTGNVDRPEKTA